MTDLTATIPATEQQQSTETLLWALDVTPWLLSGETAGTPNVTLVDLATNTAYTNGLSGVGTFVGNSLRQWVHNLVPGHTYSLIFTFTTNTGKTESPALRLECSR